MLQYRVQSAICVVACIAQLVADLASPITFHQTNAIDNEWASVLEAFIEHDADAKAALTKKAGDANPHVRALAKSLLLEW